MNKFQEHITKTELLGRDIVCKLISENPDLFIDYYPNDNLTSSYDGVILTCKGKRLMTEIKVRNYTFKSIESFGGATLEKMKVSGMIRDKKGYYDEMVYICIYKEVIAIYLLPSEEDKYKWKEERHRANNYNHFYKEKVVADLKYNEYGIALFDRFTFKRIK